MISKKIILIGLFMTLLGLPSILQAEEDGTHADWNLPPVDSFYKAFSSMSKDELLALTISVNTGNNYILRPGSASVSGHLTTYWGKTDNGSSFWTIWDPNDIDADRYATNFSGQYRPTGGGGGGGEVVWLDWDGMGEYGIIAVDLQFEDVEEDKEEDPGAFMCLNDDIDNKTGKPEKKEDDLKQIALVIEPKIEQGTATFTVGNNLKVWKDKNKKEALDKFTWNLATEWNDFKNTGKKLYVEGTQPEVSELKLSWAKGITTIEDKVKVTIIGVELDKIFSINMDGVKKEISDEPILWKDDLIVTGKPIFPGSNNKIISWRRDGGVWVDELADDNFVWTYTEDFPVGIFEYRAGIVLDEEHKVYSTDIKKVVVGKYKTYENDGHNQWGKWERKPTDGEIELVSGKQVGLKAIFEPEKIFTPSDLNLTQWTAYPFWSATGNLNSVQYGENATFSFPTYIGNITNPFLFNIGTKETIVNIYSYKNLKADTIKVIQYPSGEGKIVIDLAKTKAIMDAWNASLGKLTGIILKGPYGKIEFTNSWKETNTNECILAVHLIYVKSKESPDFFSATGKDIKIYPPIPGAGTSKFPDWLQNYLPDIGLYVTLKGKTRLEIDLYKDVNKADGEITYGTTGKGTGTVEGDLYGKIQVPGLIFKAGAKTGFSASVGSVINTSKIKAGLTPEWNGLKGYLKLSDKWEIIGIEKKWTFFDPVPFLEINIVEYDF